MSRESPAVILYDRTGNPIEIFSDNGIYRLRVENRVKPSNTASRTTVQATDDDVLLLAANPNRLGVIIFNNSDSSLHVGLGTQECTPNNFSLLISAKSTERDLFIHYTGPIRGCWEIATGEAYITELT